MKINAIIEMPAWTNYKYELKGQQLILDRVLNISVPFNYGYIPYTLAEDQDPLDVFVVSRNAIMPGTYVNATAVAVIKGKDQGTQDDKVVAILEGEDVFDIQIVCDSAKSYLNSYKKGFVAEEILFTDLEERINKYKIMLQDTNS